VFDQGQHTGAHQQYGLADEPDREPRPSALPEPLQDDARDGRSGHERGDRGGGPRHRNIALPCERERQEEHMAGRQRAEHLPHGQKAHGVDGTVSAVMTATRRASVARTGDASDMRPV
jgi:hypothetical protein